MNYYQAQNILDEVREGAQYSPQTINRALELTGDLEPRGIKEFGSERMAQALSGQSKRPGSLRSPSMVAKNVIRHSAYSWQVCC